MGKVQAVKKSIVFGANGYIGRHLVQHLFNSGHNVKAYDVSEKSADDDRDYQQLDITDSSAIAAIDLSDVDYLFNFSGLTGTTVSFENYEQFIFVNELGLLNVLQHLRKFKNTRLVFPSTRLVYQGQKDVFLKETATKESKTVYAQNKLSCEAYLDMYANLFGISYTTFRICVPYGNIFDGEYSYGTLGFFLSKARKKENIVLYGQGEPRRTFTHVIDICQYITKALEQEGSRNQTFNIGSSDNSSLKEVAKMIADKFGVSLEFIDWPETAAKIESGDTIFDGAKLDALTTYRNQHSLQNWINHLPQPA